MPVADLRLAICKRCRWDSRIASGADKDDVLLEHGKAWSAAEGLDIHIRRSQCLNCCDAGHTVRIEWRGNEVALVGIRTCAELEMVLQHAAEIGRFEVPPALRKRVYQVWSDGKMIHHKNMDGHWDGAEANDA